MHLHQIMTTLKDNALFSKANCEGESKITEIMLINLTMTLTSLLISDKSKIENTFNNEYMFLLL